ncbi:uncharacterized protein LOC132260410 [Phlebotomus argentipes]|uniref:uncharacterized protein LOC132260410 n=1 Tax=Phlebotomus argentipes TaxID=94469 RepID=UPI00289353C6|nr:uncharacterized protein LOC132260410 [Phlebotomus argentipes]
MVRVAHVIFAVLLVGSGETRVYDRCELALELRHRHEIASDAEVATWVCIAQHQSSLNTAAVGRQADGRGYHGLLQISDEFWCSPFSQGKACGMQCSRFMDDDITDDLHCSRIIQEEHQRLSGDGFNAWTVYKSHCSAGRALPYIHGCFDNYIAHEDYSSVPTVTRPAYTPSEVFRPRKIKSRAKIYDRCELAQELVYRHHIPIEEVATWVCIAQHESNFNTSAVGHLNADGSGDHGLFQISDIYWCSPPGKGWVCGLSCAQLEDDDISDDVKCMRKIYAEHQRLSGDGFNAWAVYRPHCSGRASKYIEGCFTEDEDQENIIQPVPGIVAPVQPPKFTATPAVRRRGKIYDRCELAHELLHIHAMPRHQIATWVCIAQHESSFNTAAVGRLNGDGSADHGLFQISDLYWCSPPGNGLGCGINCDLLEDDDITDDVECVKRIHKEHTRISGNGFTAWTVYNRDCLGNVEKYIEGCFPEDTIPTTTATEKITTKKFATEKLTTKKVFQFSFGESVTRKEIPSTEPPKTRRTFAYRFGDKVDRESTTTAIPKADVTIASFLSPETTTSRVFSFSFTDRTSTTEAPTKEYAVKKTQPFNIFDFYLNYFKANRKTTKKPTTEAMTEATTEIPAETTTTRKPSVFDIYLRRTTASPKRTTFFANSLPTVKPFELDYIKALTTPKNIISRSAQDPPSTKSPQRNHFDSIFDTFFHG